MFILILVGRSSGKLTEPAPEILFWSMPKSRTGAAENSHPVLNSGRANSWQLVFFLRSVYWLILTGIRRHRYRAFQLLDYHPNPYHSAPHQLRYPWQDSNMSGGSHLLQGPRPLGLQ